ncbi:peroxiredoxin family protein [Chitinophaga barathri]|nr:redoxin domain-containing protein [Chitinophaga barathri]
MKRGVTIFLVIVFTWLSSCKWEDNFTEAQVKNGDAINFLPKFKMLRLDSTEIKSTSIPNDKITILVLFDPTCHNCKDELIALSDSINHFFSASIALVAPFPISDIKSCPEIKRFEGLNNVTIASDHHNVTQTIFNGMQVPMTLIYDKDQRLRAVFRGTADMNDLIKQFNKVKQKPTMKG